MLQQIDGICPEWHAAIAMSEQSPETDSFNPEALEKELSNLKSLYRELYGKLYRRNENEQMVETPEFGGIKQQLIPIEQRIGDIEEEFLHHGMYRSNLGSF